MRLLLICLGGDCSVKLAILSPKIMVAAKVLPRDYEMLGWCPAGPVLPHGEKVPL